MYDTYITVLGNVLTTPEWRRTKNTNVLVANFRIASTARRYDKATDQWTDGDSLRVRVNCWRKLAEGVNFSVTVGDPVIVFGRMVTREWLTEANERRVSYELEAVTVGHDLGKGRARFERRRASTATSAIEDADSDARVGGELTERVNGLNAGPVDGFGDFDDFDSMGDFGPGLDPLLDPEAAASVESDEGEESVEGEAEEEDETAASGRRGRRRTREPVPA